MSLSLLYSYFAFFTLRFLHKQERCFFLRSAEWLSSHAGVMGGTLCTSDWLLRQPTWEVYPCLPVEMGGWLWPYIKKIRSYFLELSNFWFTSEYASIIWDSALDLRLRGLYQSDQMVPITPLIWHPPAEEGHIRFLYSFLLKGRVLVRGGTWALPLPNFVWGTFTSMEVVYFPHID